MNWMALHFQFDECKQILKYYRPTYYSLIGYCYIIIFIDNNGPTGGAHYHHNNSHKIVYLYAFLLL